MKHIRFTRNSGPYSPGDVAGFAPDVAELYIQRQTAEIAFPAPAPARVQSSPAPDVDAAAEVVATVADGAETAASAETPTKGRGRR